MTRIADDTLHEQVARAGGVDASPKDPCLFDRHLSVPGAVQRQQRDAAARR